MLKGLMLHGIFSERKGTIQLRPNTFSFDTLRYGEVKRIVFKQENMVWSMRHGKDWTGAAYRIIEAENRDRSYYYITGDCMRYPSAMIQFWDYNALFVSAMTPYYNHGMRQYNLDNFSSIYDLDHDNAAKFQKFIEQVF